MKSRDTPRAKPSINETPKLELKVYPFHLRYVFLGQNRTLPVIIVADLSEGQIKALVWVLKRYKRAIGWTIVDIIGIALSVCSHNVQLMLENN